MPGFFGFRERRSPLNRWQLRFLDPALERAYRQDHAEGVLAQARLSLFLAAMLYLLLGLQDLWFFPEHYPLVWLLRGVIASVLLGAIALSFYPLFVRYQARLLGGVALLAGAGPLAMIAIGSADVAVSYYLGLTLVIVWAYTFSGLRFLHAALVNLLLCAGYLAVSWIAVPASPVWLFTNFSNLLAASLLVGFSAYLLEVQRRTLFYQARLLDAERRSHEQLALSDHLTGLPNRVHFERRTQEAIFHARRDGRIVGIIFIDIDDFKPVNDSYGHHAGDVVLATLARALEETLRANDSVARLGGDEFVVLLEDIPGREAALKVAEKLREAIARPIALNVTSKEAAIVQLSASTGIALYPEDADNLGDLLRQADAAMYRHKQAQRNERLGGVLADGALVRQGE